MSRDEDVLYEVVDVPQRNPGQEQAVNRLSKAAIQLLERLGISSLRGLDELHNLVFPGNSS